MIQVVESVNKEDMHIDISSSLAKVDPSQVNDDLHDFQPFKEWLRVHYKSSSKVEFYTLHLIMPHDMITIGLRRCTSGRGIVIFRDNFHRLALDRYQRTISCNCL